jgi:hypothetical protein
MGYLAAAHGAERGIISRRHEAGLHEAKSGAASTLHFQHFAMNDAVPGVNRRRLKGDARAFD